MTIGAATACTRVYRTPRPRRGVRRRARWQRGSGRLGRRGARTFSPGGRITAPFSAASQMGKSEKTSSSRCFSPPLITCRQMGSTDGRRLRAAGWLARCTGPDLLLGWTGRRQGASDASPAVHSLRACIRVLDQPCAAASASAGLPGWRLRMACGAQRAALPASRQTLAPPLASLRPTHHNVDACVLAQCSQAGVSCRIDPGECLHGQGRAAGAVGWWCGCEPPTLRQVCPSVLGSACSGKPSVKEAAHKPYPPAHRSPAGRGGRAHAPGSGQNASWAAAAPPLLS